MYYVIDKGTETYSNLDEVWNKMMDYDKQAFTLVDELGFKEFGTSNDGVAGGISCIRSNTKPEGYKSVGRPNERLYYPYVKNKVVNDKIAALPIVSHKEFNSTIGFESHFSGRKFHRSFGCQKLENSYLVEVSDECDYTPIDGMVEILSSEYKSLKLN